MFSFRLLLGLLFSFCLVPSLAASSIQQQEPTPAAGAILTASPGEFANKGQNMGSFAIARSVLVDEAMTSFRFPDSELSISNRNSQTSILNSHNSLANPRSAIGNFFVNRIVSVTATSDSEVDVVYELSANYPTAGCEGNNSGYYQLYRRCDPGASALGYHSDGQPIPDLTAGQHTLSLSLGCIVGEFTLFFVPEDPDCFTVFNDSFTFEKGVVTFTPANPLILSDAHAPAGDKCETRCTCNSCGCDNTLGPDEQGDSATGETKLQLAGGTAQQESTGGSSCGDCGSGSAGSDGIPFIPLSFWMNNHMAAHPTSLGAGVHTPFDYSVHAYKSMGDNTLHFRMTDPGSARIVYFEPIAPGSTTFSDGLDFYREAKLIGGATLDTASHIEVIRHSGEILRFQLYESADDTDKVIDRDGRLVSWKDTANLGYDFTYSNNLSRKINVMTDAFGREYSFSYGAEQGGRPAVSSIAMPNGATVTFNYVDHVLSNVSVVGGGSTTWQWTNTKADDGPFTKMTINSPGSGEQVYRFKSDYLWSMPAQMANPISALSSIRGPGDTPDILRVLVNPANPQSVTLRHGVSASNGDMSTLYIQGYSTHPMSNTIYDPNSPTPTVDNSPYYNGNSHSNDWGGGVIEGAGFTPKFPPNSESWSTNIRQALQVSFVNSQLSFVNSDSKSQISNFQSDLSNLRSDISNPLFHPSNFTLHPSPVTLQTAPPFNEWLNGAPPTRISPAGESIALLYDPDLYLLKRTWPDATIEEFTRDTNKNITRYRDRLGNVTLYQYNTVGRLNQRQVGLKVVGGADQQQPEHAIYNYNRPDALVVTEFSPLWNGETDMYRTDYEYYSTAPNIGRIKKIIEAADTPSGTRPVTQFNWNTLGQLQNTTDPAGRVTSFTYDAIGRTIMVTYHDGSTEQTLYNTGVLADQVRATRDRNGVVTTNSYDSRSRSIETIVAAAIDANILDGLPHDTIITDPNQRSIFTRVYFTNTDLIKSETTDGRTTEFVRDGMNRARQTRRRPNSSTLLTSKSGFTFYRSRYNEDWMGRRSFNAYNAQGRLVRTLVETFPGSSTLNPATVTDAQILARARVLTANASWLITDRTYDVEGQMLSTVDERNITSTMVYDSRGRSFRQIAAVGTPVESKSETTFDKASNVTEVRSPRFFKTTDTSGFNLARTNYSYNGRELQSSVSVTLNSSQAAQTLIEYALDGRVIKRTDPRGKVWETDWHACCGRLQGQRDPAGNGSLSNTDYGGSETHAITVANYDNQLPASAHNPIDADTFGETTVRHDALGRQSMNTTWLVARGTIDPNNVPIAGVDADGSGTLDAPMSDGLTSMVFYDSNLTDGIGLDSLAGMAIPDVGTLSTINVSISNLIGQLTTATGLSFGTGSAGSAVLSVNAEQEFSVAISDGMGRTVMVAMAEPVAQSANLQAVTWSFSIYDNTFNIGTGAPRFVAETRSMDALGNIVRSRTDGAGRTLQTVDALGNISTASFDAFSNVVAARDPNQVGYDAVFDALGRMTSRTDTFGIITSSTYDLGGNVTVSVDGKGKSTTRQYDAADRLTAVVDRLAGQTLYGMDLASNLISITDAEGQLTSYSYNDRGLRASETYPDHAGGSVPGDPDCGQRFYQYDSAGRLLHVQDQANHWQTMIYDLASRLTERQYRIGAPTGTPIDSDTFALDRVGRMTSAVSGRYSNTVSMDYDSIGRMNSESLAIGGQTYVTGYERDVRNQINKIVYPSTREAEYTYTNREELDLIEWDQSQIENRGYDVGGRMTSVDRPHADETRVYDLANRLTSIANTASVGTLSYTWDANSNKLTETWTGVMAPWSFTTKKPAAPTFKEGYDDEDRFRRFIRSGQSQDIYLERTLIGNNTDLATNGTSSLRTFNAVHEMVSVGGNAQQFDNRGNVTNTHSGVGLSFDFDNRMKQATPVAGKVVDYQYDALGKRVGRKVTENSIVVEDTIYVHAGPNCVAEYNRGAAPSSPVQEYVYGTEIDSLAMLVRSGGAEKLAVIRNQQWSVVALVNNTTGSVVERYSFDQFGKRRILNASGFEIPSTQFVNPYGYTSRHHDAETGLMYFRARYYDVTTGEFTSRDPLEYVDGMSIYRGYFVPRGVDPLGLDWLDNICNFTSGVGDCITLGSTYHARRCAGWLIGSGDTTNYDSGCYTGGQVAGVVVDVGLGAGVVKQGAKQVCKRVCREGVEAAGEQAVKTALKETATRLAKNIKQQEYLYDVILKRAKEASDAGKYSESELLLRQAELIKEGIARLRSELNEILCKLGLG